MSLTLKKQRHSDLGKQSPGREVELSVEIEALKTQATGSVIQLREALALLAEQKKAREELEKTSKTRENSLSDRIAQLEAEIGRLISSKPDGERKLEAEAIALRDKARSLQSTTDQWKALVDRQKAEYNAMHQVYEESQRDLEVRIEALQAELAAARAELEHKGE